MIGSAEVEECHKMLEQALRVCTALKDHYLIHRDKTETQGNNGWKMRNDLVFARLDAFRERCSDALDFTRTVLQFNKLERVDIGGTKGRVLSQFIVKIHEEFEDAVSLFRTATYDIMDVGERQFDEDFYKFRATIKDLDRRLGSLLTVANDDLDNIHAQLKLFDIFEGLLERPIIRAELEHKHQALIVAYRKDLKEVQSIFLQHHASVDCCSEAAPIFHNLPPVAGALYWSRSLKARIRDPMSKIIYYNNVVKETPESFHEVERLYNKVLQQLDDYEQARYREWEVESVDAARQKLTMRLLRRHEKSGLLKVNFDPALTRLLREIRFFLDLWARGAANSS
jgi:dynein heavy chain